MRINKSQILVTMEHLIFVGMTKKVSLWFVKHWYFCGVGGFDSEPFPCTCSSKPKSPMLIQMSLVV